MIPLDEATARLVGRPFPLSAVYYPAAPTPVDVCPRCKQRVYVRGLSWHCPIHGFVTAIKSAVANPAHLDSDRCSFCKRPLSSHAIHCERPK